MSKTVFKTEEMLNSSEISEHLRKIADGIEKEKVTLGSGEESVELRPSDRSEFEVKVEEEQDGEISLELEIEWNDQETQNEGLEVN